jgi:hypothetical protein
VAATRLYAVFIPPSPRLRRDSFAFAKGMVDGPWLKTPRLSAFVTGLLFLICEE